MGDAADMLRENEEHVRMLHDLGQCEDWCPICYGKEVAREIAREIAIANSIGHPDEMEDLGDE
jgi:hypothetical protein